MSEKLMVDTRTYPRVFYDHKDGSPWISFPNAKSIPVSRIFQLEKVADLARALLTQPGGTVTNTFNLRDALKELDE